MKFFDGSLIRSINIEKKEKIYEGKAKIIYTTADSNLVIQYFKDSATAFDGKKKGQISDKGVMNNKISSKIFSLLESEGISTHFVETLSDREMLVKKLEIIPVEVVMRNRVAGSLAKRMGVDEGTRIDETIIEYYYKRDDLGDPMINLEHILVFKLATEEQMQTIRDMGFRINEILRNYFDNLGIELVDFKLEFGLHQNRILLGDEITPDGCRLWDKKTEEKMDKDRFRRDLGKVEEAYQEVLHRMLSS